MHETLQPDGRSLKQASCFASSSKIKPGLENSQSCGTSIPSQVKGKKRERGDHSADPVKRERSCSTDGCYSAQYNAESSMKSDIARVMQKGGLVDLEGVEKLIQLMQPDKVEKKIDLTSRSMLAGVVVATEKFECLYRFVQLKGLRVFDGWLQDCHKGIVCDDNDSKDGEKSKEEFLFDLLCALDKLPVDVSALQSSNIGRSVNHLRSHKNSEIQKKARNLIDIWKTSVNFEFGYNAESSVQPDISKVMQKDGLVDFEGVEKLIQLMRPDKVERKLNLTSRSMVAGVVVATDKLECLHRFVQLKGLRVFDEWLQDNHKGSGNDSKDSEKCVEEYLFVLLRALDKLPVNLSALQNCNIGRSVNHLRSHKNTDIQIKARSLVDIWKKRVQAEMSSVKEEMWSLKFHHQEASHDGGRTLSECDASLKSSIAQHSASKTTLLKSSHGESFTKSASSSPGPTKSASPFASSSPAGLNLDVPIIREDRSSSSNQSYLGKEEKSSTMVSAAASKTSSTSFRYREVGLIPGHIGIQKGNCSGKGLSAQRSYTSDKLSQSILMSENDFEGPTTVVSNHKLMVKIPNRVRSPVQGVGGASHNGTTSASSLASPLVASDQIHQLDNNSKQKSDTRQSNASSGMYIDSILNNDLKDILTAAGDGAALPSVHPEEEKNMSAEDSSRSTQAPVKNQSKYEKLHEPSFTPMNALIESCAEYSKTYLSFSSEDDVGMNLLASVAAGEMLRSELVSPTNSTESTLVTNEVCEEDLESFPREFSGDAKKHGVSNKPCDSAFADFISPDLKESGSEKLNRETDTKEKTLGSVTLNKEIPSSKSSLHNLNCTSERIDATVSEEKTGCLFHSDKVKLAVEVALKDLSSNTDCNGNENEGLPMETDCVSKFTAAVVKSDLAERANDEKLQENAPCQRLMFKDGDEVKFSERGDVDTKSQGRDVGRYNSDSLIDKRTTLVGHSFAGSCSDTDGPKSQTIGVKVEKEESAEHISVSKKGFPACLEHELGTNDDFRGVQSPQTNVGEAKWASADTSSFDPDAKVKFDLNEGFMVENGEQATLTALGLTTVPVTNNLRFSLNSISTPLPASVTVAASSKGLFLPPDDIFRSKGELVWKGSSITSAFRPAEPRKVVEVSLPLTSMLYDASRSKNGAGILGIDLNIDLNLPEEMVIEVMASQDSTLSVGPTTDLLNKHAMFLSGSSGSMLDFDLNMVDDSNETGQCSTSCIHNDEDSMVHMKPLGCFPPTDVQRGFDLNGRPGVDDGSADQLTIRQQARVGIPSQLPTFGPRPNIPGLGSFSSWFPPGNTYSTVAIPSGIPNRVDQPFPSMPSVAHQRTFVPAGMMLFNPDVYRGSVLSSSPAVSFPYGPLQFSMFPFDPSTGPVQSANFPVGSTSCADSSTGARGFMPCVDSQLLGPFQRSYIVDPPDSRANSGLEHSRNWGRQGLDLNAGPGAIESEVKEGLFPLSSSQRSHMLAEEQARRYQVSGNILKRTEPEGGLDSHSFRYKQSPWHPEL